MPVIEGVLLDIDGVLTVSWEPLPGAVDAVAALRTAGLPLRLLTNTTSRTRAAIAEALRKHGFDVAPADILTAPAATAAYLRHTHPNARCHLLCSGDVAGDFEGVALAGENEPADVLIVGGAGPEFTYERVNRAFHLLLDGASLVAMHSNLLWKTAGGLDLDAGAYIAGLERAANVSATVVGKPARAFYTTALAELGVPANHALMVGDDIDADIGGAHAAGITTALVRSGKFRQDDLDRAKIRPDFLLESISGLQACVGLRQ